MCCCEKPTINGQPGYSWDGKTRYTRPVNPPDLEEGDELLFDEAGRCGGVDSHSHHLRVVRNRGGFCLLVRHGGGDERIGLGSTRMAIDGLATLDSNARYWLLLRLYHVQADAARHAREASDAGWRKAAAEKRIKTRKVRGGIKVWIEPALTPIA